MRTLVCTLAATFLSVGCANSGDSTHKQLAAVQQELGRLRAENALLTARVETLESLETARARPLSSEGHSKTAVKPDDDRPPLDVLRLTPTPDSSTRPSTRPSTTPSTTPSAKTDKPRPAEPDESTTVGEVDQDEPRPVIRSTGRGEVIAQTPLPSKPPALPRPVKTPR